MTRPAVGTLIPLLRGGGGGVELPEGWNQVVTARALENISEGDPVTLSYLRPSWGENLGPAPIDLSPLVDIGEYVGRGSLSASADFRYFVHVKGFWDSEKFPEVSFYEWSEGVLNKMDFPKRHFLWLKMDKTGRYMIGSYRKDSYTQDYKFIRRDGTSFSLLDPFDDSYSYRGISRQNVAFSSDSKYLSVGDYRLRVHYDMETRQYLLPSVEIVPPSRVYSTEWMPDSRVFFVGLRYAPFIKAYLLTDTHQIEEVAVEGLNVSSSVRKLAWSNDSRFLACELVPEGDFDPTLIEIFKHDGNMNFEKVTTLDDTDPYHYSETSILFTPDSNYFIAGRRIYEITPEDDFVLTQQEYIENIPISSSSFDPIHDILVKDDMSLIVYTRPVWPYTSDPPSDAEYPMVFGPAASPENVFQRLVYRRFKKNRLFKPVGGSFRHYRGRLIGETRCIFKVQ